MSLNGHKRPTGRGAYTDGTAAFIPTCENVIGPDSPAGDTEVECDVCVIGTGAGGAPVAKELAEGGKRVVMLEEGSHYTSDDFDARHSNMFMKLYRDCGQTFTVGHPPIMLPLGRAVGGTTVVNSGTCFRTPPAVLAVWQERLGLTGLTVEALDPFFRRVEREINVAQVPPDIAGNNAQVVKRGADKLGLKGDFIYRNVRGCIGSGVCTAGCPTAAKQHVGITYVPKAWEAGAVTYTGCSARRLLVNGGRATGVEAAWAGGKLTVRAETVVVAAGTVHSPLLLKRSGVGLGSGQLGRNLTIHPSYAMRALFDEEIDMSTGVPQSYYIDEYADEGIMLEGAALPPGLVAAAMPFCGERHHALMKDFRNLSIFGAMVSDSSSGSVAEIAGRALIRYSLSQRDVSLLKKAMVILAEIYWAAGAKAVYPGLDRVPELRHGELEPLRSHELAAGELQLMAAFHPLGTCRMGADSGRSVVDENLRIHEIENLYLCDGSVVPSSLGVNPQITIMGLATRLAYHLLGLPTPIDEPEPERIAQPRVGAHVAVQV